MVNAPSSGTMRSLIAVAIVAATASSASAGTYLGLGIGTAASPGSDIGAMTTNDGSRTGRLMLGTRFGHLSVEGAGSRYSIARGASPYDGTMLAVALKYSLPLGNNFEAFGRGGLERTWLNSDDYSDYVGNGWLLGAGFEYRLDLGATAASIFVDYEHTDSTLTNQSDMQTQKGETIGLWTLGVTVAI
jgi:hypothetical protein